MDRKRPGSEGRVSECGRRTLGDGVSETNPKVSVLAKVFRVGKTQVGNVSLGEGGDQLLRSLLRGRVSARPPTHRRPLSPLGLPPTLFPQTSGRGVRRTSEVSLNVLETFRSPDRSFRQQLVRTLSCHRDGPYHRPFPERLGTRPPRPVETGNDGSGGERTGTCTPWTPFLDLLLGRGDVGRVDPDSGVRPEPRPQPTQEKEPLSRRESGGG